jgi:hypothetical protein
LLNTLELWGNLMPWSNPISQRDIREL